MRQQVKRLEHETHMPATPQRTRLFVECGQRDAVVPHAAGIPTGSRQAMQLSSVDFAYARILADDGDEFTGCEP